ncbi:MAG: LapA family protein [Candidatus Puniceispirillum sp.]|jgi:hypothetical protein|uniref:LapA family protein n=1 Tax=Candidatus Puniceispirillum sp. TaxID=2026719 RepID=UPI001ECB4E07|nr:LapA family protein [Candidatus Puniceispirillum sp.]MBT6414645.1 LapA family protein [Candidatus Puniceispirillum sp.]MBT6565308.1 LapA family protein [Candidatus Puniceispirillum sp.]
MKMITRFLWVMITISIGLFAVSFSTSNTTPVSLALWPFDLTLTAPIWLVCIICLGMGLAVGSALIWLQLLAIRARKWRLQQNFNKLEKKYAALIETQVSEANTDVADKKQDIRVLN